MKTVGDSLPKAHCTYSNTASYRTSAIFSATSMAAIDIEKIVLNNVRDMKAFQEWKCSSAPSKPGRWSGQIYVAAALPLGKRPGYALLMRLCEAIVYKRRYFVSAGNQTTLPRSSSYQPSHCSDCAIPVS